MISCKFVKEYERRLVLKSKLNSRNKIMAMNTWAVTLLRYGAGILKWSKAEVAAMDSKTRKLMTMYGAFHPKSDIHRLYLQREKGGRGLISCEECISAEENSLEPLLQQVSKTNVIETEGCKAKENFKRKMRDLEKAWTDKRMYGQCERSRGRGTGRHGDDMVVKERGFEIGD